MRQITLADRLRYRFDNTMSKGPIALIGWLFLASAIFIFILSVIVIIAGIRPEDGEQLSLLETIWLSLMRTLDAGTMGGDAGWGFRLSMLVVTFGGIFVVSTLIGVLTSGIEHKLGDLRKGRSFVVEANHTVILGWSPQVFSIISELVIANANQSRACIAVLAEQDKVEMEDAIRARVGGTGRTRIVCRTGSPIDLADLEIVNPHAARAIIILSPESADPDSHVIKTILALTNNPQRRATPYHIIAEIRDAKNLEVAKMVGRDEAQLIVAGDLIARIAVQTCRQAGLSVVYTELLDFGGDEIYFHAEPGLAGKTFGAALLAYEDSALIGLRFGDGRVQLKPPLDTRIASDDQVIAISADDDTVRLSGLANVPIAAAAICAAPPKERTPERTLILGWNLRAPTIVNELDSYVAPGSEVQVMADSLEAEALMAERCAGLRHQTASFRPGDTTDRRTLEDLALATYQHVIVLGYSDALGQQEADARTLITLLHLRDIAERAGHNFSIVSEMLDMRNRELAEVTRADDFIVSDRLVSLMLSQVSENKDLAAVFADLFDPAGAELYLKPAGDYVQLGRPLTFYTVVEAARRRGEIALGYRLRAHAEDAAKAHGVVINPRKSATLTFAEEDRVIVLAEE
ncbi:MAG TPA: potassium transporter TrkA [Anaerolineae bacterium]|nr:potassium transporter TrkA [Anaerolineae bacterium]